MLYGIVDCSGKKDSSDIFELIDSLLLKKPFGSSLAAFASDGASIMRGQNNPILQKLKLKYPNIWDIYALW